MTGTVCLITPPSGFLLDERCFVSLGILRVAACLERDGVPVEHLDLSGITNYVEAAADHATASPAWAFGLTATTPQLPAAIEIAEAIRKRRPEARIILGGPHVTLVHAAARRERKLGREGRGCRALAELTAAFDVLVAGDGDDAVFHALMPDAPKLIDADDPAAALFLTNQRYDELPWPARHLVDMDSYRYSIEGVRSGSLVAQLGCPFRCCFCGGRESAMLRRIRTRSTASVLAEMSHMRETYGFKGFMCYDDATEILTEEHGFVRFADLGATDAVAVLEPRTGEMRFEVPERIIHQQHDGEAIAFSSEMVDLLVTPEHKMWARLCGQGEYARVAASDLAELPGGYTFLQRAEWWGDEVETFHIPAYEVQYLGRNRGSPKVQKGTRCFPAETWVRFMAWYLSEGSCYKPRIRNGGHGYRICIKQHADKNPQKVAEIREVLTALGYRFSYSSNQFHIDSRELYEYLHQFGTAKYKHVPQEFKRMSRRLIGIFLETYAKGDGHTMPSGQTVIMSASSRMRSDLQEMAIKAGLWAFDNPKYSRVQFSKQRDLTINSKWGSGGQVGRRAYGGAVHCVTVSTGVVLVRRHGKAVWCGNCYDDELNVNREMVPMMRAIADEQQRRGEEWRLRGFVKAELFTEEQAEAMYAAGFRWILVGFESGSPRILENIQKIATREDNTRCLRIAHKHGLKVKALMSMGHAGESPQTVLETRDWLLAEKPDDFDLTIITTYPGTPYYDQAVETDTGVWTYRAKNGDTLHSFDADFRREQLYYKGVPGEYQSFVYTDLMPANLLVASRDLVEEEVREKLRIPFNPGAPGVRYEAAMGQLPGHILRRTREGAVV